MPKGKTIALVLGVFVGVAVLGVVMCGGLLFIGFRNADATVSPRVDSMFTAIEAGTFADTYETHLSDELRNATSKDEYVAIGDAIQLRLGELKSKSLQSFKMRQHNATSYIDATYGASFENGSGTIVAQLKKAGDEWRFTTFRVNSPVFEQDIATAECAECGELHRRGARFCPSCGAALSSSGDADGLRDAASEPSTEQPHPTEPAVGSVSNGEPSAPAR
jgi:hypothetical protein